MSEIADVVQIIRVEFEGMELAMKAGSASVKTMQKAASFLFGLLSYEKSKGKTGLKKLLMRGGDLQVFQFKEKDLKTVEKLCKKYGILYSLVPKLDKDSDTREILFHAEATPRINLMLQKMKHPDGAKIKTMDTFLDETDDKSLGVFSDFLKEEKKVNPDSHAGTGIDNLLSKVGEYALKKKSTSVEEIKKDLSIPKEKAEHVIGQLRKIGAISKPDETGRFETLMEPEDFLQKIKRLSALNQRMRLVANEKNTNLADITIAKKLVEGETEDLIKTRIPGTWGENARYLWIDKHDAMEIHDGKTILSFIDKNREYVLRDRYGNTVSKIRGELLYKDNYSRVDKTVRKKYEQVIKTPTLDKKKAR